MREHITFFMYNFLICKVYFNMLKFILLYFLQNSMSNEAPVFFLARIFCP